MKRFTRILLFVLVTLAFAACSPQATETPMFQGENPYAPQPGDGDLAYGEITVDSASVYLARSQPPQVLVSFAYFPTTSCHELRVEVSAPDDQNQINPKAYGVAENDKPCNLMALTTPLQASLNLGSYRSGHYTVALNGNQIGEFDS